VRAWYDADPRREWQRIDSGPYHRLEGEVIQRDILPPILAPGSRVLDIGCGPGRHALALAAQGHFVALADISPACIEMARRRFVAAGLEAQLLGAQACSATGITAGAGSFDVVLMYGPLYHLTDDGDARAAVARAVAALRPDGHLSAIFLTRTSVIRDLIKRGRLAEIRALMDGGYLDHGGYLPSGESRRDYMPAARTHQFAEAARLLRGAGLKITDVRSLEGAAAWMRPYVDEVAAAPDAFSKLSEIVRATAALPELIESGDHFAVTARKPAVGIPAVTAS
jgi:2-polyprenyl-3-methyl-5-hydroxy-6-metoxy-1,4-benzoquinol methylase